MNRIAVPGAEGAFSHLAAMDVDVYFKIGDIDTVKNNLSAGWVFHTVQTS